jgi:hypothetical protein
LKKILNKTLLAASATVLLFSCKPDLAVPAPGKGSLDVSNYVAIGTTIGSGYADNALYYDAQMVTYPKLLAEQFKLVGGGDFKQPLVDATSVGIGSSQTARLVLGRAADCKGSLSLAPLPVAATADYTIFTRSVGIDGPFNNMSVPGAKAVTVLFPGYGNPANGAGNYNPFFTRMAGDPATASILTEAAGQNATFFSLSIGNDDVLGYALSGGAADAITPASGPAGAGFDGSIDAIVDALTANGSKGVIGNVTDITSMPYFTTVPYNGLLLDQANAEALTAAYSGLGIAFHEGNNGFIIADAAAPGSLRQIQQGELVLLTVPQDSIKCGGWGSMKPIPNQYVLTLDEIALISAATTAYNAKLQSVAQAKGLAYVDVNGFMSSLKAGIIYNGLSVNTQFVSGGAFSLDGVNLTARGNALLANEFIKSINGKYGSSIPQINATGYKGVVFP